MKTKIKESEIQNRVDTALKYADTTKSVVIGCGAIEKIDKCLKNYFENKPALIIADTNTFFAAGQLVLNKLHSIGYQTIEPFIFKTDGFYAKMEFVDQLQTYLSGKDVIPIAVGSGTINDITKLASERCGLSYMSVATAGSMDGYTAFGASILYMGAKQTFKCKAPRAVIADIEIIAAAPKKMNASGYADLIAKIPSGADWIVADALGIDSINETAWNLTQNHLRKLINNPAGIKSGDKDAVAALIEGLIMTGLGMQVSKTSRPASGAEHQFSHLWDNQHHTFNGSAPSHGFKVGIGSLSSEALYENMLLKRNGDFEEKQDNIKKWWPEFNQIENSIRGHFPDEELAIQAIAQCKEKYIHYDALSQRIHLLNSIWPELRNKLKEQLLGTKKLQQMLIDAGAPSKPEEIGISRERLKLSYSQAQLIRQRFTILDFVLETNSWNTCVNPLFEQGGLWYANNK